MTEVGFLKKIKPFFKDGVDFSSVKKPTDILDFPFADLKAMEPQWASFLEDFEIKTIQELAKYQEPLKIEGIDPEDLNKLAMISEMIFWRMTQIAEYGEQKKKIVFLGLANAGKTSALTAPAGGILTPYNQL